MNLYEIEASLKDVIERLEENGGELTPELEEALAISEDAFKVKIDSYVKVIKSVDADIEACKAEEKRIKAYRDKRERLKQRLSNIVCAALNEYGAVTKTGTRYLEYPTYKVSCRETDVCEIDKDKVSNLNETCMAVTQTMYRNNWFKQGNNAYEDVVDVIRETIDSDMNEQVLDYTDCEVQIDLKLTDVLQNSTLLDVIHGLGGKYVLTPSKTSCKEAESRHINMIYADMKKNNVLTIK